MRLELTCKPCYFSNVNYPVVMLFSCKLLPKESSFLCRASVTFHWTAKRSFKIKNRLGYSLCQKILDIGRYKAKHGIWKVTHVSKLHNSTPGIGAALGWFSAVLSCLRSAGSFPEQRQVIESRAAPSQIKWQGWGGVVVPLRAENLWLVMACVEKCKMKTVGVM